MNNVTDTDKVKKLFRFEKAALILGFIVDTITIATILLTINLPRADNLLPSVITPWVALIIWILATYIYLAYLHHFWETNISKENLSVKFSTFMVDDLFFRFRYPWKLLPLLVLIVLLGLISYTTDLYHIGLWVFSVVVIMSLYNLIRFKRSLNRLTYETEQNREQQRKLDENWKVVKEQISVLLSREQFIDVDDLEHAVRVLGIPQDKLSYFLARYALEYPNQAKFDNLYQKGNLKYREENSRFEKVLINLKLMDREKYYY